MWKAVALCKAAAATWSNAVPSKAMAPQTDRHLQIESSRFGGLGVRVQSSGFLWDEWNLKRDVLGPYCWEFSSGRSLKN